MTRTIIEGRVGLLDQAMVELDQACGYGRQVDSSEFWKLSGEKTITAREEM